MSQERVSHISDLSSLQTQLNSIIAKHEQNWVLAMIHCENLESSNNDTINKVQTLMTDLCDEHPNQVKIYKYDINFFCILIKFEDEKIFAENIIRLLMHHIVGVTRITANSGLSMIADQDKPDDCIKKAENALVFAINKGLFVEWTEQDVKMEDIDICSDYSKTKVCVFVTYIYIRWLLNIY